MLPASRYLLLGSSWSGCAFFSSPQWCYFPRTCLLSLGLFGAPQSFRKEILVKKYLLWIIQWPLALVLRAIMKSWSVPLLSMQLLILDTPIISLFSLVLNKSLFFFFQLEISVYSASSAFKLYLIILFHTSFRSAVPAFLRWRGQTHSWDYHWAMWSCFSSFTLCSTASNT